MYTSVVGSNPTFRTKLKKMKIILHDIAGDFNPRKITIVLSENTEFDIRVNPLNSEELIINKGYFGEGDSAITVKPNVSNEIRVG